MRQSIFIISIITSISSFPLCLNAFAWGINFMAFTLPLTYLLLLTAVVFVVLKKRIGYFLILIASLSFILHLNESISKFLIFDRNNLALVSGLLIPFLLFMTLIP